MKRIFIIALYVALCFAGISQASADAKRDCTNLSGDAAIKACDEAIRQNPRDPFPYLDRGYEYAEKGEYDRALADYEVAIRLNPKYALAYNNRGHVYQKMRRYDQAIDEFTKAIQIDALPKAHTTINIYVNRCTVYRDKGDLDRALADCMRAVQLTPSFAKAYSARGDVYRHKNDKDRAIADYRQALKLDPANSVAIDNLRRYGLEP